MVIVRGGGGGVLVGVGVGGVIVGVGVWVCVGDIDSG